MSTDLCNIFRQLCLKKQIPVDECILSCLSSASKNEELHLRCTTMTDTNCLLIAKTVEVVPTVITVLNLSDCLLSFDGLKSFLDVVNQLTNLSYLNLKGNQIGKDSTIHISKILLNNSSITDLQLDLNNIGDAKEAFAQLCDCLKSNTVLNTLNLAKNNLCEKCGLYLAEMLNINRYLKVIDLRWNNIGEAGATSLSKSLKENYAILELNIQGNFVSEETLAIIVKQLEQNQSTENQNNQNRNSNLLKLVISEDENYETQIDNLKKEHQNRIDELETKLRLFQIKNEKQKHELEELKTNCLKEKESKTIISNQVEKIKSELILKKLSLNSLLNKISNEVFHSDDESTYSLEDFEKIIFIIKKFIDKILKDTKVHRQLSDTLPKLKDELHEIKTEFNNIKTLTEIKIQNYFEELTSILNDFKISRKINNEKLYTMNLQEQDEKINDQKKESDQTNALVLLDAKTQDLIEDKSDLDIKLAKSESAVDTQTVQALENSLMLAKEELKKFHVKQPSNMANQNLNAQLYDSRLAKEIETLKMNLIEKDLELKLCEQQMNIKYTTEISKLKSQWQCEKNKFIETKKEDQKQIEKLYLMLTEYINKLKKNNFEDAKCDH